MCAQSIQQQQQQQQKYCGGSCVRESGTGGGNSADQSRALARNNTELEDREAAAGSLYVRVSQRCVSWECSVRRTDTAGNSSAASAHGHSRSHTRAPVQAIYVAYVREPSRQRARENIRHLCFGVCAEATCLYTLSAVMLCAFLHSKAHLRGPGLLRRLCTDSS